MKCNASNFFQIDCSPAATRLASHYDQVVFYNTASGVYNSIQVKMYITILMLEQN